MVDEKRLQDEELEELEDDEEYEDDEYEDDDEYDDDEYEDDDEEEYSIYDDWTPPIRIVAWGSIIITIVAAIVLMNTMFKNI